MRIGFEIIDDSERIFELQHLGECATPIQRRVVFVDLTPDQCKALALKPSRAMDPRNPTTESYGNVFIQPEPHAEAPTDE